MPTLLEIRTSIFADGGESSRLAALFVERWRHEHPDGDVVCRDLTADALPHLTAERFQAFLTPEADRTPAQVEHVGVSDTLIGELEAADEVVLGLPMYNFGIPSALKAWFDHVARAGVTFRYTEQGSIGLVGDKPMYVMAARGGVYAGTDRDVQTGHVNLFFNLLGFKDIRWVYAEGLAISPENREQSVKAARQSIEELF